MNQMTKGIIVFIVVAVIILGGYVFYTRAPIKEVQEDGPVKIGWMGPLSGGASSYGESIKRGAEMALREIDPGTVEIIYEDTKCEGKDAVNGVNKLISVDRVAAIIGEVCSGATLAAAPIANQNEVVLISAASTSPKLSKAGSYIFRTVPSDALQGAFGAKLVYGRGNRKLAVLYSNEEYGVGFNDVVTTKFGELGGEVVASEAFDRKATDLRAQITKVKDAKPDAIYVISNNPESGAAALKQIKELGVEAEIFGSEGLKSDDILEGAGVAAEGLIVTSVSSGSEGFAARHRADYDGAEPGPFAAQGYDAMRAINLSVLQGARTGVAIEAALRKISFTGASGRIKFDAKGDVAGNYDIVIVKSGEFIPFEELSS